jgi:ribosomal protein L37AE/L43A
MNRDKAKRMQQLTAAQAVVATGTCPTCGTKLYRNLSLSGWWQCGHYGAVGFQKEAGPNCDFQIFYDPTPEQHAQILAQKKAA